jgi:hypothetical protein
MSERNQIPEWNGWKLENGEFLNYSKDVSRIAHGFDAAKVPLGDRLATLDAANVKLTDFINESRKYGETAEIAKLDSRRDIIFRAIWKFVETLSELDGAGEFDFSARRVQAALAPYKGLNVHSLTKETEEIKGLIYDLLEKGDVRTGVEFIGLNAVLGELTSANNVLAEKYNARTDAGIGRDAEKGGETTASLRKSVAEMVTDILATVNALDRVMPSDATAAAVTSLTSVVSHYRNVASQGGKRHEEPEPEPVPPNNG